MKIGVLALQGGFSRHVSSLQSLGAESCLIRKQEDLSSCSGLILPGGESTALSLLLQEGELKEGIISFAKEKPVFGTCAGLILLAKEGLLDVTIERNAYGRQIDSFSTEISLFSTHFEAIFIRAPKIKELLSPEVRVHAYYQRAPVFIQQKNLLAATFHPELTTNPLIHHYFLRMCHDKSTW